MIYCTCGVIHLDLVTFTRLGHHLLKQDLQESFGKTQITCGCTCNDNWLISRDKVSVEY